MSILKNLREVLKGLKHKKLSKPAPKFCPKCGSHKIKLSSNLNTYPRMYGITPSQYICESCGYKGPIAIEIEEEPS
jgi:C4-type Zn-finger protein